MNSFQALDTNAQILLQQAAEVLKRNHPEMEFFLLLIPFHRATMQHLSTEQRAELEKRVTRAASREFERYITHPDEMRKADLP